MLGRRNQRVRCVFQSQTLVRAIRSRGNSKIPGGRRGKLEKTTEFVQTARFLGGLQRGIWIDSGRMTDGDDGPAVNHEGKQMRLRVQGGAGFPARARSPEKSFSQSLTADEPLSDARGLL